MPTITPGLVTQYILGKEKALSSIESEVLRADHYQDVLQNVTIIETEIAAYVASTQFAKRQSNARKGFFGGAMAGVASAVISAQTTPVGIPLEYYFATNAGKSALLGGGIGLLFDKWVPEDPKSIKRFNDVKTLLEKAQKKLRELDGKENKEDNEENNGLRKRIK
jgi:hypothetical protein